MAHEDDNDFKADPKRQEKWRDASGFPCRAIGPEGRWGTFDIAQLDKDSFTRFVKSRGEVSDWAMIIFYGVFGYPRD